MKEKKKEKREKAKTAKRLKKNVESSSTSKQLTSGTEELKEEAVELIKYSNSCSR